MLRRPAEIDRKDPRWCGSGKKFKHCHWRRELRPAFNIYQVSEALRKELSRRYCSYGDDDGNPCKAEIIGSHTVQREGGLRAISRNGKVYSMLANLGRMDKNDGKLEPTLVGLKDASAFPGFCKPHDNDLFRPIEGKTCAIGGREALLFAYRAACYEAYFKRAQRIVAPLFANLDDGKPVAEQELWQHVARTYILNAEKSEAGTRERKMAYDRRVRESDLDGFHYRWTRFDGLLPVVCCGTFLPDNDLAGSRLQRLGHGPGPYEQVALNITSFEGTSVLVFGWTGAPDGPAARFVASFERLPDARKAAVAVRLPLEYLENSFIEPDWWESLTAFDRDNLVRHDAKTFAARTPANTQAVLRAVAKLPEIGVAARGGFT